MLTRQHLIRYAVIVLAAVAAVAAHAQSTVDVRFPRGSSGTTINASITGYEAIDYRLAVSAGQTMSVRLDTDNASNYFNITAPGASAALFIGSSQGNSTTFQVPSTGTYTISVYLMRNAARRNETARYAMTIYVDGRAQVQQPAPVQNDFADGLAGGPDYWQVHGLSAGDTLNVRAAASANASIVGRLVEGDVVRNRGCQMNGSTRWCMIETNRGLSGWVAGRYLHESFSQAAPPQATTLPSGPVAPIVVPPATPPGQTSGTRVSTADMPRYCTGEASARFGLRPTYFTTNAAIRTGDMYVTQGWFDANGGTTFYNCYFQTDGSFIGVN